MSVTHSRHASVVGRQWQTAALLRLGQALQMLGLVSAAVWLALAVKWSDHGEGAGYATPLAVLAAFACLAVGSGLKWFLLDRWGGGS